MEMGYKPICNRHNNQDTRMASIVWVFYVSKIFDFVDTFVMIVKGSWAQLSFLHVYHHTSIFLVSHCRSSSSSCSSFCCCLHVKPCLCCHGPATLQ